MKKILLYSFIIVLLFIITLVISNYPFSSLTTGSDTTNTTIPTFEEQLQHSEHVVLFEEGYTLLDNGNYEEALDYYKHLQKEIFEPGLKDKNNQLVIILERLNSAQVTYKQELEILNLAEEYQETFLNPSYDLLADIYEFYHLSVEVLVDENYDKETDLMDLYSNQKYPFNKFKRKVLELDSPFLTDEIKKSFELTVLYSLYPTEIHYKTNHLEESVSMEEIEEVETAWLDWSVNYQIVVDYYHDFDKGKYQLQEQILELRDGYQEMRRQIRLLIPELKGEVNL